MMGQHGIRMESMGGGFNWMGQMMILVFLILRIKMKYTQIKNQTYRQYKRTKKVYCPYLKADIIFSSQGFWHLIYTGRNEKREKRTQLLRFKLFSKAVKLLSITTTLQEFEERKEIKTVYFGFIAIIGEWKIKTIVKRTGNGEYTFWSVIPNWVTNVKRDRKFCKGNMEKD